MDVATVKLPGAGIELAADLFGDESDPHVAGAVAGLASVGRRG